MPTVIREFARAGAGEVGTIASGVFSSGALLTAVRNGSDNLELIVWTPDAANLTLTRETDSADQAGEVGEVALAMMGDRCITAVQNADGYLLLIPWRLEPDGTISRLEIVDHQAGKASTLSIVPLSDSLVVTPVRNGAGNLLIIPWSLDAATGHITRLNQGPAQGKSVASGAIWYAPAASSVLLEGPLIAGAPIDASNFVTGKINAKGGLELWAWTLDAQFESDNWTQADVDALADFVCMAPLGDPGPQRDFVLAHRKITPTLAGTTVVFQREVVVSIWRASSADGTIVKLAEATADELGSVSLAVGTIGSAGRTLVFLSGHTGDDLLVNLAFEAISDSEGRMALVLTGKLHDESFEDIGGVAPVTLASGQFATTLGHGDGLGLVGYNLSDLSATLIRPLAESTAGEASAIRVRAPTADQAMVALRNGSGNLQLIGWQVAARDFAVTRAADTSNLSPAIAAQDTALVIIGQRAVTAIRAGSDRLRLDSWDVAADLSSITPLHQTGTAAGEADLITATVLDPDLVVTAVRNGSGNLLLIVWRLEPDGTLSRLNHENAQAGEIDEISLTTLDASNVITAVRDGGGNLLVIGWHIGTDGSVKRWAQDGHAGEVQSIAVAALGGARNIVTAVRDGSDSLLLIAWRVSVDDRTITRLTDSGDQGHEGGDASDISVCICQTFPSGRETIVTAQRRDSGNLKLLSWQLLDDPSGVPMLIETGEMTNRGDLDVRITDLCSLEPGRIAVAAYVGMKASKGLWVGTMQVRDAQISAAPANILQLVFQNPPIDLDPSWADSGGDTYPGDKSFEWQQVLAAKEEYDDATLIGASGWIVGPEESGADVPFSHPFGFDWEFGIAADRGSKILVSPANVNKEEQDDNPNENGIVLADQLGLTTPEGLLGLEWDKGLLPASYRGQVNHGDRIAVLGRWILDNGHDVDGLYRTEIHPPLLIASAAVVQPDDGGVPRTRALFMSRPYLSAQTYTTDLDTRYQDGVNDDGPLLSPLSSSHAFNELLKVLTFRSTMIEMHSKIKAKPFRGSHHAEFVIRAPGPRPRRDAQLMVAYHFNLRTPCQVAVQYNEDNNDPRIRVTVDLVETSRDGRAYQPADLPPNREETYSTDELDLLSPGSGSSIALGEDLIEILSAALISGLYGYYLRLILDRGIKTDVFDPLPEFDVLDRTGGVLDIPARQIVAGAGILGDNGRAYPITGWVEAYWAVR